MRILYTQPVSKEDKNGGNLLHLPLFSKLCDYIWMTIGTVNKILFTNMTLVQCFSEVLIIAVIFHVHSMRKKPCYFNCSFFSNSSPVTYRLSCFIIVVFLILTINNSSIHWGYMHLLQDRRTERAYLDAYVKGVSR
jgi:hypothetical protein